MNKPNQELLADLTARIANPFRFADRNLLEPFAQWAARAVLLHPMFQLTEATDGSGQPYIHPNEVAPSPQPGDHMTENGLREYQEFALYREHLKAANAELANRNLELQLAQGHLREAKQVNDGLCAEVSKARAAFRAEREHVAELESEADKARKIIAGNTLLDMLNSLLGKIYELERAYLKLRPEFHGNPAAGHVKPE